MGLSSQERAPSLSLNRIQKARTGTFKVPSGHNHVWNQDQHVQNSIMKTHCNVQSSGLEIDKSDDSQVKQRPQSLTEPDNAIRAVDQTGKM